MAEGRKLKKIMEACTNGDQGFVKRNITNETVNFHYVDAISERTLLEGACQCLGPDVLTRLLKQAGLLGENNVTGREIIFLAIEKQQLDLIDCLIKNGAELNVTDQNQIHLLSYAAHHGEIQTAQTILTTHKLDNNRTHLLQLATKCKDLSQMNILLTDIRTALNDKDSYGYTPLLFSCRFGNAETTRLLLENKAKLETCDNDGKNPLMMLIYRCRPNNDQYEVISEEERESLIKLVLANGVNIDDTDIHGWTALHHATYYHNLPVIDLLLHHKCDLNKQTAHRFAGIPTVATAVYIAVAADDRAAVELLCCAGADCNLATQQCLRKNTPVRQACPPLFTAVVNHSYVIAAMLHKYGAQIDMVSEIYYQKKQRTLMEILVENRPIIKRKGEELIGNCPTSEAKGDKLSFIMNIIEQGFDVNQTDSNGNTMIQMMLNSSYTYYANSAIHMDILDKVIDIATVHKNYKLNHQNYEGETTVLTTLKALDEFSTYLTDKQTLFMISVVDKMVCKSNINTQDDIGRAVVHYLLPALLACYAVEDGTAAKQMHSVVLKCFALGARKELRCKAGNTAFHSFISDPSDVTRSLSPPNLQQEIYEMFIVADDTDKSGVTVLHRLVNGHPGIANLLPLFLSEPNQHSLGYINARYPKKARPLCEDEEDEADEEDEEERLAGLTALQICITHTSFSSNHCWKTLPYLLRSGVDVHMRYSVMKQALTGVGENMRGLVHLHDASRLYHIIFMLMSAGAKFSRRDIQPQHRHLFDNLEVALIKKSICKQMLERAVKLGYKFNTSHLDSRLEDIDDIDPTMRYVIESSAKVARLGVLSAQVIRWNLYPNAWCAAEQLRVEIPTMVYREHFEIYQKTAEPGDI